MGGQQSKGTKGRGDATDDLYEDQLISINIKKKRKNHGSVRGKLRGVETAITSSLSIDSVLNCHNTKLHSTQNTLSNSNKHSRQNDNTNIIRWDKLMDGTISTPAFDKNNKTCEETIGSRKHKQININPLDHHHHHYEEQLSKFPRNLEEEDGVHDSRGDVNLVSASSLNDDGSIDEKENIREQQSEFIVPPPKIRLQILSPVHSRHQNQQHHHFYHQNNESRMSIPNSQQLCGKGDMKVTDTKKVYDHTNKTNDKYNEMNLSNEHQKNKVKIHVLDSNTNNDSSQNSYDSEMRQNQNQTYHNSTNNRNHDCGLDKNTYNISTFDRNENNSSQSKKLIPIYCSPKMIKNTFSEESESVMSHPRYHTKPITKTPISKTYNPINHNNNNNNNHYNFHNNRTTTSNSTNKNDDNNNNNNMYTSSRNSSRNGPVQKIVTAPNPRIPHSVIPTTRETVSTAASKRKLKVRGLKNFVDSHRPCPPLWSKQFPCRSKFHPDNYLYDFEGWNAPKRPVRAMEKCPKKCGRCNRCGVYTDSVCKKCNNCSQDCKCDNFRRQSNPSPNPIPSSNTTTIGPTMGPPRQLPPSGTPIQSTPFAPTPEHFMSQLFGSNWSQTQKIQVNNVPVEPDKPKLNLHVASSNNPLKIKNSKPALATGYDTYTPAVNLDQQQQQQPLPQHFPGYGYHPYGYPTYPYHPYPSMSYMPAPSVPYYGYAPPPQPLNYC